MTARRLDPIAIRQQVESLLERHPDLADDEILHADMIEGETEAFDLLDRLIERIQDAQALADGTGLLLAKLADRKKRFERREEALRELALGIMRAAELPKAERPGATLSIGATGRSVIIVDETALPADCLRTRTEPDKAVIRQRLKDGYDVPGAMVSNGGEALFIYTK